MSRIVFSILASLSLLFISSCSQKVGNIGTGNPDVVDNYKEGGYNIFGDDDDGSSKKEKMSIQEFVNKKCSDAGFSKGYDGYTLGALQSDGSAIAGFQVSENKYRKIKVWCKR
jgi:hypothetical protein